MSVRRMLVGGLPVLFSANVNNNRKVSLYAATALPQLDAVTDEGMAKIVNARRGVTAAGHPAELYAQLCKDCLHLRFGQSSAGSVYKKMLPRRSTDEFGGLCEVANAKPAACAAGQRDLA